MLQNIGLPELLVMVGVFVIVPLTALSALFVSRYLQTKERLRAIEKGVPIPRLLDDPWERTARLRHAGIIWIAAGLGSLVILASLMGPQGMAFAAVPVFIGIGLLIDYRLRVRDLRSRNPM